jgi:hypothetical protein
MAQIKGEVPVTEAEVKAAEAKAVVAPQPKLDLNSLPVRSYLDQTVVPLLLQGMNQLVCVPCAYAAARLCSPLSLTGKLHS